MQTPTERSQQLLAQTPTERSQQLLAQTPDLETVIDREWERLDHERELPDSIAEQFYKADLLRIWTPRELGGLELDPLSGLETLASISSLEGSVGWNAMILGAYSFFAGRLPTSVAKEIWGDPRGAVAGALHPGGKAVAVDGGYRVSGRWTFASGCKHASWLLAQCLVERDGEITVNALGLPELSLVFMRREHCEIHDVWHVSGLRGTGSHDYSASDVWVPSEQTFALMSDDVTRPEPIYRFPAFPLMTAAVASVPIGIARGAIRITTEILRTKQSMALRGRAAEHVGIQADLGRARMDAISAERVLFSAVEDVWSTVQAGERPSLEQRAAIRVGCINAGTSGARAVDTCYTIAGSASIFESNHLERSFRDVHAAAQHVAVSPKSLDVVGRVTLGLEPGGLI